KPPLPVGAADDHVVGIADDERARLRRQRLSRLEPVDRGLHDRDDAHRVVVEALETGVAPGVARDPLRVRRPLGEARRDLGAAPHVEARPADRAVLGEELVHDVRPAVIGAPGEFGEQVLDGPPGGEIHSVARVHGPPRISGSLGRTSGHRDFIELVYNIQNAIYGPDAPSGPESAGAPSYRRTRCWRSARRKPRSATSR